MIRVVPQRSDQSRNPETLQPYQHDSRVAILLPSRVGLSKQEISRRVTPLSTPKIQRAEVLFLDDFSLAVDRNTNHASHLFR
jgi:hypothetical protein